MSAHSGSGILKQPRTVWVVAFACVIAFMGIGLVDPILPAIADNLGATPTEAELLFTSYLLVTGLAMLVTAWVSSRIGARWTLLIGLALIVLFALGAAMSDSVEAIISFRAGWGLGNALFISTALATIVGAASGGSGAAIVLYEAALGIGIAIGPLLGGLLGSISWRGPFFGTAALMAVAVVALAVLLPADRGPREKRRLSDPIRALRTPALALLAVTALFYNIGFFTLLAFSPFPLGLDAIGLGLVFCAWGIGLAITSVWAAPMLTARMPRSRVLAIVLPLLALDLVAAGLAVHSVPGLIAAIIVGGLLLGILNTVLTETVMDSTDLPRPVASSAYSSVRFLGGAAAPPLAALLASLAGDQVPYYVAAGAVLVATGLVVAGRPLLARADAASDGPDDEAEAIGLGDAA